MKLIELAGIYNDCYLIPDALPNWMVHPGPHPRCIMILTGPEDESHGRHWCIILVPFCWLHRSLEEQCCRTRLCFSILHTVHVSFEIVRLYLFVYVFCYIYVHIFLNAWHIIAHLSEQAASPHFYCLCCPSSALSLSIQNIALRCSQHFATYIIYGSLSGEICTKCTMDIATAVA